MNKDFELKHDPYYSYEHLRERINSAIKQVRDDSEELDLPQAKTMPIIPVTGQSKAHKYLDNKSARDY